MIPLGNGLHCQTFKIKDIKYKDIVRDHLTLIHTNKNKNLPILSEMYEFLFYIQDLAFKDILLQSH